MRSRETMDDEEFEKFVENLMGSTHFANSVAEEYMRRRSVLIACFGYEMGLGPRKVILLDEENVRIVDVGGHLNVLVSLNGEDLSFVDISKLDGFVPLPVAVDPLKEYLDHLGRLKEYTGLGNSALVIGKNGNRITISGFSSLDNVFDVAAGRARLGKGGYGKLRRSYRARSEDIVL